MTDIELLAARTIALEHAFIRLCALYLADVPSTRFNVAALLRERVIAPPGTAPEISAMYVSAKQTLDSMISTAERIAAAAREAYPPMT